MSKGPRAFRPAILEKILQTIEKSGLPARLRIEPGAVTVEIIPQADKSIDRGSDEVVL